MADLCAEPKTRDTSCLGHIRFHLAGLCMLQTGKKRDKPGDEQKANGLTNAQHGECVDGEAANALMVSVPRAL